MHAMTCDGMPRPVSLVERMHVAISTNHNTTKRVNGRKQVKSELDLSHTISTVYELIQYKIYRAYVTNMQLLYS